MAVDSTGARKRLCRDLFRCSASRRACWRTIDRSRHKLGHIGFGSRFINGAHKQRVKQLIALAITHHRTLNLVPASQPDA